MRRFFNILLGALAMIAVALLSAFLAMRLAIHGREVEVPNVAGLTVPEARDLASNLGLNLNVENHFYSTVTPAGRVLSQYPAPGNKVRREWVMRVAESIGPQKVSVPDVIGQTEREAAVTIRRLSLDLGTVAYIPAPGLAGVVVSQTPNPAAAGVDGPRISLLVSEPVPAARMRPAVSDTLPVLPSPEASAPPPQAVVTLNSDTATSAPLKPPAVNSARLNTASSTAAAQSPAPVFRVPAPTFASPEATVTASYVMPNLIGLSFSAASSRVAAMGLRVSSIDSVATVVRQIAPIAPPAAPGSAYPRGAMKPITPLAPITLANTVVAQSPAAGRRVTRADAIRITLSR